MSCWSCGRVVGAGSRGVLMYWYRAGGQDLRAGDPAFPVQVTRSNCCVFCLQAGKYHAETLHHVIFECPTFTSLRLASGLLEPLQDQNSHLFAHHRDLWSWKQMRSIRKLFCEIMEQRSSLGGGHCKDVKKFLQDRADKIWDTFASSTSSSTSQDSGSSSSTSSTQLQ